MLTLPFLCSAARTQVKAVAQNNAQKLAAATLASTLIAGVRFHLSHEFRSQYIEPHCSSRYDVVDISPVSIEKNCSDSQRFL